MSEVAAKEEVVIKVRENGPLLVTGPVRVVDHLGNKFDTAAGANIALCRCGASLKKPFCDGRQDKGTLIGADLRNGPSGFRCTSQKSSSESVKIRVDQCSNFFCLRHSVLTASSLVTRYLLESVCS